MIVLEKKFGLVGVTAVQGEDWVVVSDDHGVVARGSRSEMRELLTSSDVFPAEAIEWLDTLEVPPC